ncbi:MocR-like pyridoxine biosynthesis transcription factor PdxR [Streptomyces sp. 4N509B]|uniref:MocR-like pyridoxine biosynthesis transcription factor PdxR n=1 Tax=Streptomyces sp. 4N509B TaxID=3457413 RepID=UPI003FD33C3D
MEDDWATSSSAGLDLHLDLRVDVAGSGGKRAGLTRALREAIRDGRLAPGTRLPSSRSLAADLGMARNTVADAYAELTAEGWLLAHQGSGTRVAPRHDGGSEPDGAIPSTPSIPSSLSIPSPASAPGARTTPRARSRWAWDAPQPRYSLVSGHPDPAGFPRAAWLRAARRAVTEAPSEAFNPGDPQGRHELRVALAAYLARARGVRTDPGRIVIAAGFSHALGMLAELVPGPVAVESYGLAPHRRILTAAGLATVTLPVDEHGARVGELPRSGARTALLTPAHQFPTGGWLPAARRTAVVDWARTTHGLLLEDDYDGEFRYDRQPLGAVQGLDPEHVVFLGSVSKSLTPAVRLGWLVLPERLVGPVLDLKGERELRCGVLDQLTLAEFVRSGGYDQHLRRTRQRYRRRRDLLRAALGELAGHVPGLRVTGIAAGLHLLVELPDGAEEPVVAAAARRGLALQGLRGLRHADGAGPWREGLVVGFGTPPEHSFAGAVAALGDAVRDVFPPPAG